MKNLREELEGLPGAELVCKGLEDLARGEVMTPEALLVAMARPKLRSLDLEIPALADTVKDAELKLYALLGERDPEPYGEYKALRGRLTKFENALDNLRAFEDRQRLGSEKIP